MSTPAGRPDPATYRAPGGVFVPARLADPLLRDMLPIAQLARRRARLHPEVLALLEALAEAAAQATSPTRNATRPSDTMEEPRWLTVQETAAETGYTPRRIQQLARSNKVRARPVGRAWLIDLNDLRRHLAGRRHP